MKAIINFRAKISIEIIFISFFLGLYCQGVLASTLQNEKEEAVRLFHLGTQYESQKNSSQSLNSYLESAKFGYIPAKIKVKESNLGSIKEEIEAKKRSLAAIGDQFGINQKNDGELTPINNLCLRIFELESYCDDISHDLDNLRSLKDNGKLFFYDFDHHRMVLPDELPQINTVTTARSQDYEQLKSASASLFNYKRGVLNKALVYMEQLKKLVKTPEALNFIQEIREKSGILKYLAWLNLAEEKLNREKDQAKQLQIYQYLSDYQLREIDEDFPVLNNVLKVIKGYSLPAKYTFTPSLFKDLQQLRDNFLPILILLNQDDDFGEPSYLLSILASYFIQAHDDSTGIVTLKERLQAKMIFAREAEKYLTALQNPSKYMQLMNPKTFNSLQQAQDKEVKINRYYSQNYPGGMEFDVEISVKLENIQRRMLVYSTRFMNEEAAPHKAFFRNEAGLRIISEFLNFATFARRNLLNLTFTQIELRLKNSNVFIYPPYTGQSQNIWTHATKPYSIRVKKNQPKFTISLLGEHPYDHGILKIVRNGYLICEDKNELIKFSSNGWVEFLVPPSYEGSFWYTCPRLLQDALMDNAHYYIKSN